jgi:integrase/recombinase XerD
MGKKLTTRTGSAAIVAVGSGTRATSDNELLASWVASLGSGHSRRNFEATARRFLAGLQMGLRAATVEDVRDALGAIAAGLSASTARQYVLRIKSLLTYAQTLGYTRFNAGVTIKVRSAPVQATLAKRIVSEVEIGLLVRGARSKRDRMLLAVGYASGLRVSELVSLTWADVIERENRLQLSVAGKGGVVRQVLLPEGLSRRLLARRGDAGVNDPVFAARHGGPLTERAVHSMVKRAAKSAGITEAVSPHWLRHAHGSHALDRGASLAEVQSTLGHSNVATTSAYLHARPNSSSGLYLDEGIFRG